MEAAGVDLLMSNEGEGRRRRIGTGRDHADPAAMPSAIPAIEGGRGGAPDEGAEHPTAGNNLQTRLAIDRTVLAAERTYAAWMRTGLAALASGIGAHALLDEIVAVWLAGVTGSVLILFSCFCFLAAVWRQLGPDLQLPPANARKIPPWVLVFVNGFLALVTLTAMIGLWIGN